MQTQPGGRCVFADQEKVDGILKTFRKIAKCSISEMMLLSDPLCNVSTAQECLLILSERLSRFLQVQECSFLKDFNIYNIHKQVSKISELSEQELVELLEQLHELSQMLVAFQITQMERAQQHTPQERLQELLRILGSMVSATTYRSSQQSPNCQLNDKSVVLAGKGQRPQLQPRTPESITGPSTPEQPSQDGLAKNLHSGNICNRNKSKFPSAQANNEHIRPHQTHNPLASGKVEHDVQHLCTMKDDSGQPDACNGTQDVYYCTLPPKIRRSQDVYQCALPPKRGRSQGEKHQGRKKEDKNKKEKERENWEILPPKVRNKMLQCIQACNPIVDVRFFNDMLYQLYFLDESLAIQVIDLFEHTIKQRDSFIDPFIDPPKELFIQLCNKHMDQ